MRRRDRDGPPDVRRPLPLPAVLRRTRWQVDDADGGVRYRGADAGLAHEIYHALPGGHLLLLTDDPPPDPDETGATQPPSVPGSRNGDRMDPDPAHPDPAHPDPPHPDPTPVPTGCADGLGRGRQVETWVRPRGARVVLRVPPGEVALLSAAQARDLGTHLSDLAQHVEPAPTQPAPRTEPRPMNLVLLNAFVTVADTGSISAAAKLLGCSQPGLSQRLQTLEHRLGCHLFHREPTGTRLTTTGTTVLPLARDLLHLAHRIHTETQQHPQNEQ